MERTKHNRGSSVWSFGAKGLLLLVVLLFGLMLAGCQKREKPLENGESEYQIYYMTQVGIRPPHFVVFCNDSRLFHFSYQRYLENCLRNTFGLEGTPITLSIRQRGEKEG